MFLPSRGTAYDLRFALFGIPVTVSPFFWVVAFLLGFRWISAEPGGPVNVVGWILCMFLSLLLHEFGHALTMRAFGHRPEVVLHHFGGYATYGGRETPGRSLLISAAGPGAQLVFFVALVVAGCLWTGIPVGAGLAPRNWLIVGYAIAGAMVDGGLFEKNTPLYVMTISAFSINLIWPIFNMLPVLPLDGGRMLSSTLALSRVRRPEMWAHRVGLGVAVVAAVFFLVVFQAFIAGAMFAYMAMANYQALQGEPIEGA